MSHRLTRVSCLALLAFLACAPGTLVQAGEPSHAAVAARLSEATVTVRILPAKVDPPPTAPGAGREPTAERGVTICSGVCVGRGLIATFVAPVQQADQTSNRFRITLPDGEQARAVLRVADRYSGLLLLEIPGVTFPHLTPAEATPPSGSTVLTAAAAGIEKPAVSLGIIGGTDRSPGASGLPPLLQCDVRTTEASCGAAVVDGEGKLLGIVAVTPLAGERRGWTYAVPARHVQRLIAARADDKIVVLERRRPSVGLTMGPGTREGTVEVEHVVPGGPADKAGIRQGDLIVEADGRKIRSAYQAVDLILNRQPGETLPLVVSHDGQRKNVDVTLEGQAAASAQVAGNVGPQLKVRVVGRNQIEVQTHLGEVAAGAETAPQRSPGDEVEMLRIQLDAFEKVITKLRAELKRRDQEQARTDELMDNLRKEVDALRRQLNEHEPADAER